MEIWKTIEGYDKYQISNTGAIKSFFGKEKTIALEKTRKGYLRVKLNGKKFYVHRLVGAAFIPNPDGKSQINHKNKITSDNRIENLEWVTSKENLDHQRGLPNMTLFSISIKSQINKIVPL